MSQISFRAMVVTELEGNKFSREIATKNISELPEGDVLISVKYSSLNYKDALSSTGNKGVTRKYPHTPGIDAAGIVVESADQGLNAGDQVIVTSYDLGMNTSGGFAEYIRVPSSWVVKLPQNLSLKESMIFGTAGLTAALSVYKLVGYGVKPEDGEILVTGATGGVGIIAVAILHKLGYRVLGLTGKPQSKDLLISAGASDIVPREELDDQSGRPLLKTKYAGVIDTVGGNILATALKTVNYGGCVTSCGNVASPELITTVYPFILRGVTLFGVDSVQCPMALRISLWNKLANEWKPGDLTMLAEEVNLAGLDEKIDMILKGKVAGRTVVNLEG